MGTSENTPDSRVIPESNALKSKANFAPRRSCAVKVPEPDWKVTGRALNWTSPLEYTVRIVTFAHYGGIAYKFVEIRLPLIASRLNSASCGKLNSKPAVMSTVPLTVKMISIVGIRPTVADGAGFGRGGSGNWSLSALGSVGTGSKVDLR